MLGGEIGRNAADFKAYTRMLLDENSLPVADRELLAPQARAESLLLMGLRLKQGVELATFERFAGASFESLCGDAARRLASMGLLELTPTHVRATSEGLLLLDNLVVELAAAMEPATA